MHFILVNMNYIKLIAKLFLLLFMMSCFIPITDRKNFRAYKQEIFQGSNKFRLRFDGIYVSTNSSGALAFYSDGKVKSIGSALPKGSVFWSNPKKEVQKLYSGYIFDDNEIWGEYHIINDTPYSESFGLNYTEFIVRQFFIKNGQLLSDTTFAVNSSKNTHYNIEFIKDGPNVFRFYKTKLKPDSTKVWYQNKRWYKKGLHASRKRSIN